jgi:hypothetical protein
MGELIKYGLKIAFAVGIFATLLLSILNIINYITVLTLGGFVSEVFKLIGLFMPFNASALNVIAVEIGVLVSFAVSRKIFILMSDFNRQT